ncbi:unnamed protein product [Hymenolepis diminuta]|uniref:Uncharacterized protein n=1 Tax=Hymenolepis diminuta TaxID=6216 RepID=A0A564ZEC9_HYMDI|nr:unnamed protein product [Hymenolepis diminuta]
MNRISSETSSSELCPCNYHPRYTKLGFPIDKNRPLEDTRCLSVEILRSQ